MIFNIHVNRTSGSSFRDYLIANVDETYLYYPASKHLWYLVRSIAGLNEKIQNKAPNDDLGSMLEMIRDDSKLQILCGHYTYKHITKHGYLQPQDKLVTWVREPVSRCISEWKWVLYNVHKIDINKITNGDLDNLPSAIKFEAWIDARKHRSNSQGRMLLDGRPLDSKNKDLIDKYDFIGVFEHRAESLNKFNKMFQIGDSNLGQFTGIPYNGHIVDEKIKEIATKYHKEDIEFYNMCLERFHNERC